MGGGPPAGADAKQLAADVRNASSDSARVTALDAVFGAIGLGVRDPSTLAIIVPGGEKSASDAYLYSPEVSLVSQQLAANRRISFDELAEVLDGSGINYADPQCPVCVRYTDADRLSGPDVQDAVRKLLQAAQGGSGKSALYGQIIRDLQPTADLGQPVASNAEVIDPLQQLMIESIFEAAGDQGGAVQSQPSTQASAFMVHSAQIATGTGAACSFQGAGDVASFVASAKGLVALAGGAAGVFSKAAAGLTAALAATDFLHAAVLGVSVHVSFTTPQVTGAFGLSGPNSAGIMHFALHVEMLDQLSRDVINCGALAGYTFPEKGGIPNIKVNFHPGGLYASLLDLLGFGRAVCPATQVNCSATTTGGDGNATFDVRPFSEYLPNTGPRVVARGHIHASALTLSGTGNSFGQISEGLGMAKFDKASWAVTWHQPRGYAITGPMVHYVETTNTSQGTVTSDVKESYQEAVCLGKNAPIADHPLEPPANYFSGQVPIEVFGQASLTSDPDFGYILGTATDTETDNQGGTRTDTYAFDTRQGGQPRLLPIQESMNDNGSSNLGEVDTIEGPFTRKITGDVAFSGGLPRSEFLFDFVSNDPNTTISPNQIQINAAWQEATRCPQPMLDSDITPVG